jgi:hypothetical protein
MRQRKEATLCSTTDRVLITIPLGEKFNDVEGEKGWAGGKDDPKMFLIYVEAEWGQILISGQIILRFATFFSSETDVNPENLKKIVEFD